MPDTKRRVVEQRDCACGGWCLPGGRCVYPGLVRQCLTYGIVAASLPLFAAKCSRADAADVACSCFGWYFLGCYVHVFVDIFLVR